MRITRFANPEGEVVCGVETENGNASLLKGSLTQGFALTGQTSRITRKLAPLDPVNILCIGLNYKDHAEETGAMLPEHPVLFMKNTASLNHPDSPIEIPADCLDPLQVDFEAELAVVMGKTARNVRTNQALDYVFGYTAANDVSARRWQKHGGGGQWVRGKSFDTFCPLGPALITADEIPDPQILPVQSRLNGNIMQESSTANMIFSVAEIIAFLSTNMTLLPGTVILTGTPAGVGFVREPKVFLKPGDIVEVTIQGIGSLRSPVTYSRE